MLGACFMSNWGGRSTRGGSSPLSNRTVFGPHMTQHGEPITCPTRLAHGGTKNIKYGGAPKKPRHSPASRSRKPWGSCPPRGCRWRCSCTLLVVRYTASTCAAGSACRADHRWGAHEGDEIRLKIKEKDKRPRHSPASRSRRPRGSCPPRGCRRCRPACQTNTCRW